MTKVNIISGFLGAGKTTFIKKLLKEVYNDEQVVLIENEFGEIGIDSGFLKDAGIEIKEMNSGCICCSLVGDFSESLKEILEKFSPDRIIIEPTGVGKLSDVVEAVRNVEADLEIDTCITVCDATKCKMYMKNFGEFYNNQVKSAGCILLSRMDKIDEEKLHSCIEMLREVNPECAIITTPLDKLTKEDILSAFAHEDILESLEQDSHGHHHHYHDEDCDCGCHEHHHEHHHHDEDCDCGCHEHHHEHHHHNHDCDCHEHHHEHHHHDHDCDCGCHDHHHHHADETFTSWGVETPAKFTKEKIETILSAIGNGDYGTILRGKGMVAGTDGEWIYFDMVPEEYEIRQGSPQYTGKICVIGAELKEDKLKELFGV